MKLGYFGKAILFVPVVILCLVVFALIQENAFDDCGLSEIEARNRVLKELKQKNWPESGLKPDGSTGTCFHYYNYIANDKDVSYAVSSTWVHGVKLSWFDNAQDRQVKP
jgi:hypothetical protein